MHTPCSCSASFFTLSSNPPHSWSPWLTIAPDNANQCFLLADGSPMTKRAILEATLKHPHFRWLVRIFQFETPDWSFHLEVKFTAGEGIDGKVFEIIPEVEVTVLRCPFIYLIPNYQTNPQVYNCGKVREVLGWKPAYANFQQFMDLEAAKLWALSSDWLPNLYNKHPRSELVSVQSIN